MKYSDRGKTGVRSVLREMFRDTPEDYIPPEEIEEAIRAEDPERAEREAEDEQVLDYIEPGSERERQELAEAEEVLRDLYAGCLLVGLLGMVGVFAAPQPWRYALALFVGCLLAIRMLRDMYQTIDRALSLTPQDAERFCRKRAVLRYVLILAFLAAAGYSLGPSSAVGGILGVFSMKLSAYMQSLTRKLRVKIHRKRKVIR